MLVVVPANVLLALNCITPSDAVRFTVTTTPFPYWSLAETDTCGEIVPAATLNGPFERVNDDSGPGFTVSVWVAVIVPLVKVIDGVPEILVLK